MAAASRYGTPRASYRLQLRKGFGFEQAQALVPYLYSLGVSHLYLSPLFTAVPGSTHGYDVVDHSTVNPELGGLDGLLRLGDELLRHGMGLILDLVPNHVGIAGAANPWWRSVLCYGERSPYADYFDIDWDAPQLPAGTLLLPVLGEALGVELAAGNVRLGLCDGDIVVRYYDQALPLGPESYAQVLGLPPSGLPGQLSERSFETLNTVLREFTADYNGCEAALQRLRAIIASEPALASYVEQSPHGWNGHVGEPRSFNRLEALLRSQHYLLADWRVAASEINYRRFFDQNSLAAIRVERPDVFGATHRLVFDLVRSGIVTCVRVDHIDGLYDPGEYLARLKAGLAEATACAGGGEVPILVEKILADLETLPPGWDIAGTTGYEVMAHIDRVLIDSSAAGELTRIYNEFTGDTRSFDAVRFEAKQQVTGAFGAEISMLARHLQEIGKGHRVFRDVPVDWLRAAVETTLACFPVYRPYLSATGEHAGDSYVEAAIGEARVRNATLSESALSLLREVLVLEGLRPGSTRYVECADFRRKFQQVASPVMAKGVEDTAFFRYNRLISLNEVGNDPARFGEDPAETHAWFQAQTALWPAGMSASSTHDTKRSEDVRARLHALSEFTAEWEREVIAWRELNRDYKSIVGGQLFPDSNLEYYLYQTLVGSWPEGGEISSQLYHERLHEQLTKIMLEAKVHTTWAKRNDGYESTCHAFLERLLASPATAFQQRVGAFVSLLQPVASINSLSMLLIKCLAVGFPDFYQGNEAYQLALTDPDNRRAVDFNIRRQRLSDAQTAPTISNLSAPGTKLWLTHRLLEVRRDYTEALSGSAYASIAVHGRRAGNLFVFSRGPSESLVVIAPRLARTLVDETGFIPADAWADTEIYIEPGPRHSLLDNRRLPDGERRASVILGHLPFAVLARL